MALILISDILVILCTLRNEEYILVLNAVTGHLRLIFAFGFLVLSVRLSLHSPIFFFIVDCIAVCVFG